MSIKKLLGATIMMSPWSPSSLEDITVRQTVSLRHVSANGSQLHLSLEGGKHLQTK